MASPPPGQIAQRSEGIRHANHGDLLCVHSWEPPMLPHHHTGSAPSHGRFNKILAVVSFAFEGPEKTACLNLSRIRAESRKNRAPRAPDQRPFNGGRDFSCGDAAPFGTHSHPLTGGQSSFLAVVKVPFLSAHDLVIFVALACDQNNILLLRSSHSHADRLAAIHLQHIA